MNLKNRLRHFAAADLVTGIALIVLTLLTLIFSFRLENWPVIVFANLTILVFIWWIVPFAAVSTSRIARIVRDWYGLLMILYIFKLTYFMVYPVHPVDYDWLFIKIDLWMFGVHPTQWLMRFSHPVITEILQISYSSYYFILFIVLCESYRRKNRDEFFTGGFLVLYGFYLSYIGYFVVPGVGPRFTLHDFGTLNSELPGLWLTSYIRDLLNAGESIPAGVTDAIRYVQRDVFPSGHTQLTLVSIYLAFKYRIVSRWIILVLGTLLIIATVYLRYHYVVDVIGGVIFFLFTIWSGTRIERWWKRQWM